LPQVRSPTTLAPAWPEQRGQHLAAAHVLGADQHRDLPAPDGSGMARMPSGIYYRMRDAAEVERYDDIRWTGQLPQQPQRPQ
jgi:hypothetical protein